jgi:hypothetical protein
VAECSSTLASLDLSSNQLQGEGVLQLLERLPLLLLRLQGNPVVGSTRWDGADARRCPAPHPGPRATAAPPMLAGVMPADRRLAPLGRCRRSYRKRLLAAMPSLNHLDDCPVFPKERRLARAFCAGGLDAERSERDQISAEEAAARWARLLARLGGTEGWLALPPWRPGVP